MKQARSLVLTILVASLKLSEGVNICPTRDLAMNNAELIVTSPGWPNNYPSNGNCKLQLSTSVRKVFVVKFENFDVEEDEDNPDLCDYDSLTLNDGKNMKTYCGEEIPGIYQSASNTLSLQFKSDRSTEQEGFKLKITTKASSLVPPAGAKPICEIKSIIRRKKSGSLISPNFPFPYPNNVNCNATIRVLDNFMTTVWFKEFKIQAPCTKDKLIVKDELKTLSLCGTTLPSPLHFYGHSLYLAFTSDNAVTANGFHMKYNMTKLRRGNCMCFNGLEYITVSKFHRKTYLARDEIKFRFKTRQANGLILYSKGTLRDYIYIALQRGTLFYEEDLGTGVGRAVLAGVRLNDNKWHKVVIRRREQRISITVDRGKYKDNLITPGGFKKLNIPNSVGHVLGAPSKNRLASNYIGCIRHFYIDGREPLTNAWAGKPDYKLHGKSTVKLC